MIFIVSMCNDAIALELPIFLPGTNQNSSCSEKDKNLFILDGSNTVLFTKIVASQG